jgi:hypothetical protein
MGRGGPAWLGGPGGPSGPGWPGGPSRPGGPGGPGGSGGSDWPSGPGGPGWPGELDWPGGPGWPTPHVGGRWEEPPGVGSLVLQEHLQWSLLRLLKSRAFLVKSLSILENISIKDQFSSDYLLHWNTVQTNTYCMVWKLSRKTFLTHGLFFISLWSLLHMEKFPHNFILIL